MSSKLTTTVEAELLMGDASMEISATVQWVWHPPVPERYNRTIGTWDPPEGDSIEDIEVLSLSIGGEKMLAASQPPWLLTWIVANVDHDTLREVSMDDGPDPDAQREDERDERDSYHDEDSYE